MKKFRKKYKVKKILWEDVDYDEMSRVFLNSKFDCEWAFCIYLTDYENEYRFVPDMVIRQTKDIDDLKFKVMVDDSPFEVISYDGEEVVLQYDMEHENHPNYNMICRTLKRKGISVHKIKIPLEKDVTRKSNRGLENLLFPIDRIRKSNVWKELFENKLWKFTRYTYEEYKEDECCVERTSGETEYKKKIYLVGPCIVAGRNPIKERLIYILEELINIYCDDKKCMAEYEVVPLIVNEMAAQQAYTIFEQTICKNDIVLIVSQFVDELSDTDLDMTPCYNQYAGDGCLYEDVPIHTTVYGNELIAKEIMSKILQPFINTHNPHDGRGEVLHYPETYLREEENELLIKYIETVPKFMDCKNKSVGCIVMNANPFTKGHYHLVKTASSQVDYLYIFVVEEDKSEFSFKDRLEMVKQGCGDFHNVFVVPSGEFIISSRTFNNYFEKDKVQEKIVDTSKDVSLFGKYIAPSLHITERFVGEEPFDKVTLQYNEMMKKRLPQYGVEVIEIPRVKEDDTIISASIVRKLIKKEEWSRLSQFVPVSTVHYIQKNTCEIRWDSKIRTGLLNINIKNWDKVREWILTQKAFIIYGTGLDATYIWENIGVYQEHVLVFCDKKANTMKYTFQGRDVIKPDELQTKYMETPILISTRRYNMEIYVELCRRGIDEKHIMVLL